MTQQFPLNDFLDLDGAKPTDGQFLLEDFSEALGDAIEEILHEFKEPIFINPTTGKKASSVYAVMITLGYDCKLHWGTVVRHLTHRGGASVFSRWDLKSKPSVWATCCVDLDRIEDLLLALQPRKAKALIQQFKVDIGIA